MAVAPTEALQLCCFSRHLCSREKLTGHDYCLRHILEDRGAPYRTCNFSHRGRKCSRPAPKSDRRDGYCLDHSRRTLMSVCWQQARGDSAQPNANPCNPVDRYLDQLKHYKGLIDDGPPGKKAKLSNHDNQEPSVSTPIVAGPSHQAVDSGPNKPEQKQLFDRLAGRITTMDTKALTSSEMDSEEEQPTVDNAWCDQSDSDTESVDWSMDSPLRQAGVYSAEEVIRIMREKLIRLQRLYLDQFQRLKHRLCEEKRRYRLKALAEKEANLVSIHSYINSRDVSKASTGPEDNLTYQKLKDLNHFQIPRGLEAVLHHQLLEKRAKASEALLQHQQPVSVYTAANILNSGSNGVSSGPGCSSGSAAAAAATGIVHFKPSVLPKCSYHVTSSTKCGETVVPTSKFCLKHILEDPGQVLFRKCGVIPTKAAEHEADDGPCETPIADLLENAACVFHTGFQDPFTVTDVKSETLKVEPKEQPNVVVVEEPNNVSGGYALTTEVASDSNPTEEGTPVCKDSSNSANDMRTSSELVEKPLDVGSTDINDPGNLCSSSQQSEATQEIVHMEGDSKEMDDKATALPPSAPC